ncbi:MAG: DUF4429 domain-containing protein [Stackebrandtia sp.]
MDESGLTVTFKTHFAVSAFKKAMGVRHYPLSSIQAVSFNAPGKVRNGTFAVRLKPGADALRMLLKDPNPAAANDPDTLTVAPVHASAAASFAQRLHHAITTFDSKAVDVAPVATGTPPVEVSGSDGRAVFDGRQLTLKFGGFTAHPSKKALGTKVVDVDAIADVQIKHPGLSGWIRFAPAAGPLEATLPPNKTRTSCASTQTPHCDTSFWPRPSNSACVTDLSPGLGRLSRRQPRRPARPRIPRTYNYQNLPR